ncbi:hypothetical protein BDK51DRAFT_42374 [Blyttiomyces helicus]|uniref:Uncharacterized protein n=1 Tax=Blyttiomyces helicus TaxID=388810 RepID=A0A4V1IRA6_9FUNG|nr:hypothetical protein BDK51DRAFT_42374 [Blyttiomyces helicus]|eukprot:RKO89387.1 hypothetical protein BDK51DRAFT_42374 [Blyttiomyces helicus]
MKVFQKPLDKEDSSTRLWIMTVAAGLDKVVAAKAEGAPSGGGVHGFLGKDELSEPGLGADRGALEPTRGQDVLADDLRNTNWLGLDLAVEASDEMGASARGCEWVSPRMQRVAMKVARRPFPWRLSDRHSEGAKLASQAIQWKSLSACDQNSLCLHHWWALRRHSQVRPARGKHNPRDEFLDGKCGDVKRRSVTLAKKGRNAPKNGFLDVVICFLHGCVPDEPGELLVSGLLGGLAIIALTNVAAAASIIVSATAIILPAFSFAAALFMRGKSLAPPPPYLFVQGGCAPLRRRRS